jgi:hypothetical protein
MLVFNRLMLAWALVLLVLVLMVVPVLAWAPKAAKLN